MQSQKQSIYASELPRPLFWMALMGLGLTSAFTAPQMAGGAGPSQLRSVVKSDATGGQSITILYLPFINAAHVSTPPSAGSRIYWGALVDNCTPPTQAALQPGGVWAVFEAQAKKKVAILHWGQPWKMNGSFQPFQKTYFDNARAHGSLPLLDWGSWALGGGPDQPDFQLRAITAGRYDAYIQQWAQDAKAWGHPFFLRFDWEMNGNWQFPWSVQLNGNQPADYVQAWRHVHDIFERVGADNVTWVWCPNISSSVTVPLAAVYPGDSYVDWTCLDGYNKETAWVGFNTVFSGSGVNWIKNSYTEILAVAPTKPVMIGETASREAGDGGAQKAQWISDTFLTQLPVNFPRIKAVVWFNWEMGGTFPIATSSPAREAFANAIGSNYYAANEFANQPAGPILPLP